MQALGMIETYGFVAAVEASDAALKAANVSFQGIEFVRSGIITVTVTGDVGAVKAAVSAGCMAASLVGEVRASHVIPRLADGVEEVILNNFEKMPSSPKKIVAPKKETTPEVLKEEPTVEVPVAEAPVEKKDPPKSPPKKRK